MAGERMLVTIGPINMLADQGNMVNTYTLGFYSNIKESGVGLFARQWLELEILSWK